MYTTTPPSELSRAKHGLQLVITIIIRFLNIINGYNDRSRVGDMYIRKLFYASILYYYDKFGDTEIEKAARICFLFSYHIRLSNERISMTTVDNKAKDKNQLFYIIKNAVHPSEVLSFKISKPEHSKLKDIEQLQDDYLEEYNDYR